MLMFAFGSKHHCAVVIGLHPSPPDQTVWERDSTGDGSGIDVGRYSEGRHLRR